jgi:hypothetical protein
LLRPVFATTPIWRIKSALAVVESEGVFRRNDSNVLVKA